MKTRIISGIVMGVIVAAVLLIGYLWQPIVITLAVAFLVAGAIYELVHNAAGIKDKASVIGASVYGILAVFAGEFKENSYKVLIAVGIIYCIYAVFMVLKNHSSFDLAKIALLYAIPIPFAIAFFCLRGVVSSGVYYLLLMLNFSSVCDMGAYFVGVTCGKHKLCPNISPKKTVEGAIGGIVSSIIVAVIIVLSFGFKEKLLLTLLLTIPLCVMSMIGDLFASAIKRSVNLKDYGNLIPGHGGIMDRVDSIIMIAPLMYILISFGVL